jgi:hypothetical protein
MPLPRGIDSIGIKWAGEVVVKAITPEPEREPHDLPETRERPLGWK